MIYGKGQDALSEQEEQDAELRSLFQRYDPAGIIDPKDSMRLESSIADYVFCHLQPGSADSARNHGDFSEFFVVPAFLRGPISWSITLGGTMALGLLLGFFVSSLVDTTPYAAYDIAMTGPWQHLIR